MTCFLFLISIYGCENTNGEIKGTVDSGVSLLSATWSFLSSGDYTFGSSYISVSGNRAALKTVSTTFNDSSSFSTGTYAGSIYSGGALKLDLSGTPTTDLSTTWAPQYSYLSAYYKFNSNLNDSANGTYNGSISSGSLSYPSNLKVGDSGLTFTSSSNISLGDNTSLNSVSQFSFTLWVKPTSTQADWQALIVKSLDVNNRIALQYSGAGWGGSDDLAFTINSPNVLYTNSNAVPVGSWTHVAIVYNGALTGNTNRAKIYINGELRALSDAGASIPAVTSNLATYNLTLRGLNSSVDDFSVWSKALTLADITLIYNRQKQKYAGSYDSPVIDMGTTGATWTSLTGVNSLPFFKELTGSSGSESSSAYSSIGGSLVSGLVGLWHLNESSGTTVADSSGNSGGGGSLVSTPTLGATGILNKGVYFANDKTKYVSIPASASLDSVTDSSFTFQAWYYPYAYPTGTDSTNNQDFAACIFGRQGNHMGLFQYPNGSFVFTHVNSANASFPASGSVGQEIRKWHHVVGVFDISDSSVRLYVNGKTLGAVTLTGTPRSYSGIVYKVGVCSNGAAWSGPANGIVDEVGIWSRALSPTEVLELYRRGANRVKYQARSCIEGTCACKSYSTSPVGSVSDCDGDGTTNNNDTSDSHAADWIGPDGTASTFFSELHNNASVDSSGNPTGSVNTSGLTLDWSGSFFTSAARPSTNRYFQYRVYFESDDENTLCSSAACVPEVSSVTIGPTGRYYGGSPSIIGNTGVSISQLKTITKSDINSCSIFQISIDGGSTWKWWDGSAWATAGSSVATANYISDFTETRISELGSGTFKFKAFLNTNSTFTQACELSQVGITYFK